MAKAPAEIEAGCTDPQLLKELRPWLIECGKLGERGKKAIELMDLYRAGHTQNFWQDYLKNCMRPEDKKAYEAHKLGTMKLQPFYDFAMEDLADVFYEQLSGQKAFRLRGIGTYKSIKTMQSRLMFDADSVTYYTSGVSQKDGDWMGVALPELTAVSDVHILQGRNSKDDSDFYDHATLEYSVDGYAWQPLLADLKNCYDILWQGEPVMARYIRLRRLDSARKNWAAIRSFVVTPADGASVVLSDSKATAERVVRAFDRQLNTAYKSTRVVLFEVPHATSAYTFLLDLPKGGSVRVCQYDKRKRLKAEMTTDKSFFTVDVAKGVDHIELVGKADVYEVIPKRM